VVFGILQRYVMGEVLRAFTLALLTITSIFVLFMVMAEAARAGLTPFEILQLVPFITPTSLPYTIPVALLFSVTVVYGRLAADNEVIAVKTAGLSAMTLLMPSFMIGLALSLVLLRVSDDGIPKATKQIKKIIFSNVEDYFYKVLKKERELNNPEWPFYIKVKDVEDKKMIGAIFKHRTGVRETPFDYTVKARSATVSFDLEHEELRVRLEDAESTSHTENPDYAFMDGELVIPLPNGRKEREPRIQELTYGEMLKQQANLMNQIKNERKRQAVAAAMWIGSGRIHRVDWPHIQAAFRDYVRWERKYNELETEQHFRRALAWGTLFFVLLGAPVGILFHRRDFLSAFISCFLPIIGFYYPLLLFGVNLGKEGLVPPMIALWWSNFLLAILAGFVMRSVLRH
jgi:lipopolysaccharide export LptBFGC system permease protein LptF